MKEVITMLEPRRILVPTDFTEDSDRALREAIDIAAASRGRVYLLHVDDRLPIVIGDAVLDPKTIAATEKSDEMIARQKMAEEVRKVASGTNVEVEIDERHGVTFEEIAAYMKDKLIDLVIIGPHARKGLLKGLQARVTNRLMKEATCPMLVLPSLT
jgi:universal stress protein A